MTVHQTRYYVHELIQIEVDEETSAAVVIDGRTGVICSCNETAAVLINAMKNGASRDELVRVLLDEFKVQGRKAQADVLSFLDMLSAMGYLASSRASSDRETQAGDVVAK